MKNKHSFGPLRRVLVPVVHGCRYEASLAAARSLASEAVLIGLARVLPEETLSSGAEKARQVRAILQSLEHVEGVRVRARVRVSRTPWTDLEEVVRAEHPDLLLTEWRCFPEAFGIPPSEVLARPICDIALVQGPFPSQPGRVLIPLRGGPHAELALRLGLSLRARQVTSLHLRAASGARTDAPFRGLERVLRGLPEVQSRFAVTNDPAKTILKHSRGYDVVIMGATAQPLRSRASLGQVADRVLNESTSCVIAVKTRRPMPLPADSEAVGSQAISILVDKWFAENTFQADEFGNLEQLLALKRKQGVTISVALPALNEEETVGKVIRTIKRALCDKVPLLDEIVLVDSDSADRTRDIAATMGIPVFIHQQLIPTLGPREGKGEALWKSLLVTQGDILAWIDTDIVNIHPRFVYGVVGPLLLDQRIQFVKGFYRRPLRVGDKLQAGGGGRVTELTARPLLNLFYPELSGMIQPLSGEYAGRRRALEQLPFFSGYGVETGLLIDVLERYGLSAIAQVDLLERIHHNQPLEALGKMSFAIIQAVIRKLERRYGRAFVEDVNKTMKLIRHGPGGYYLDVEEIAERERPPMVELEEYRQAHPGSEEGIVAAPEDG